MKDQTPSKPDDPRDDMTEEEVDEALEESFPASDPPSYPGMGRGTPSEPDEKKDRPASRGDG